MIWWALLLLAAGCGRLGFGESPGDSRDSADSTDGTTDDVAPTDLVVYLPLDDVCAPAQCTNCPAPTSGLFGTAVEFDGVDDSCSIPDEPNLHLTSGFTVSLWIRPSQTGNFGTAISKPKNVGPGPSFELAQGLSSSLFCTSDALNSESCLVGPILLIGGWTHVALVWDGTTKQFVLNGVEEATEQHVTTFEDLPLLISGDTEDGNFRGPFPGAIDEVRIYNRALTMAELVVLATPPP